MNKESIKKAEDIHLVNSTINKVNDDALMKNSYVLQMFEDGRIDREELLMLISTPANITLNITQDNRISASSNGGEVRVINGESKEARYSRYD